MSVPVQGIQGHYQLERGDRMKRVRALKAFEYPTSRSVRDAIRRHHRTSTEPFPWDKRGASGYVEIGQVLDAPDDLLVSWLDNGLVEEAA